MKPARFDYDIYQGRTFRKPWVWRNPRNPDGSAGTPINLTGYHARLRVTNPSNSAEPFIDITDVENEQGVITLGGAAGTIEWYISDEQTAELDFGKKNYHFDVQDPVGDWIPLLRGSARLWKTD